MKTPLALLFASTLALALCGLAPAQAAHTAFVFNTDGNALPAEVIAAINARGGAGTQIVEIRPGVGGDGPWGAGAVRGRGDDATL